MKKRKKSKKRLDGVDDCQVLDHSRIDLRRDFLSIINTRSCMSSIDTIHFTFSGFIRSKRAAFRDGRRRPT